MATGVPERMPRNIKFALTGVWFQAVVNLIAAVFVQSEVDDRQAHGQEVQNLGLVHFAIYVSYAVAAALLLSGVFAGKRFAWVRVTILWVEGLAVVISLINLVSSGVPTAVLGLLLAFGIASVMMGQAGREWFYRGAVAGQGPADWGEEPGPMG